ncbi:hypothetical protein RhiirA5_397138 [Rhizophagus irregularis]|uniref:HECT domain-containing protein n=1 Tax=Rhizophagus irregularis TaxID=588596 RepID=A0A2N0PZ21_9GLOM|nr:hypothetical protein RhiirA5_397138 [Rhizophagus irregularis]
MSGNFPCVRKTFGNGHVLEHFPDAQIPDIFLTLQNLSRICPESSITDAIAGSLTTSPISPTNTQTNNTRVNDFTEINTQNTESDENLQLSVDENNINSYEELKSLKFIKSMVFSHDNHEYINYKMLKEFPILQDFGWILMKPNPKNDLIPYQTDKIKDGKLLKKAASTRGKLYIAPELSDITLPVSQKYNSYDSDINLDSIIISSESSDNENHNSRPTNSQIQNSNTDTLTIQNTQNLNPDISIHEFLTNTLSQETTITDNLRLHGSNANRSESQATLSIHQSSEFSLNMAQNQSSIDNSNGSSSSIHNTLNAIEFRKQHLNSLKITYGINDGETTKITIIDRDSITDYLLNWAHSASAKDLIKEPIIEITNENVTDIGGAYRDSTELLWNQLKTKNLHGGIIFDGDSVLFIRSNPDIDMWNYAESVGKLLFWCWLHHGSWPRWLHQMHMNYIFEGIDSISYFDILKEYIPLLYKLALDVKTSPLLQTTKVIEWADNKGLDKDTILAMNNIDLSLYIAKYEVIDKRIVSLEKLKSGFNIANSIKDIKQYGWKRYEEELYMKLDYSIFFQQFNNFSNNITINNNDTHAASRKRIFSWFQDYIRKQPPLNLEIILKFITGCSRIPVLNKISINWISDSIRLARASTCSSLLILNQTYEDNHNSRMLFERELDLAFFYSDGFDEAIYRNAYNQIGQLTNNINDNIPIIDLTYQATHQSVNNNNNIPVINLEVDEETNSLQTSQVQIESSSDIIEVMDDENEFLQEQGGPQNLGQHSHRYPTRQAALTWNIVLPEHMDNSLNQTSGKKKKRGSKKKSANRR